MGKFKRTLSVLLKSLNKAVLTAGAIINKGLLKLEKVEQGIEDTRFSSKPAVEPRDAIDAKPTENMLKRETKAALEEADSALKTLARKALGAKRSQQRNAKKKKILKKKARKPASVRQYAERFLRKRRRRGRKRTAPKATGNPVRKSLSDFHFMRHSMS